MSPPGADQWVALLSFSAAALKCSARDRWIGWDFRHQYDRLKLVTNNSRFLILPDWHFPNLASRILSLCQKRLAADWQAAFGHPVVLLETFVDPQRFRGTIYKAANWIYVGDTKGFHRTRKGYSATAGSPKMVFVKPLTLRCASTVIPAYSRTRLSYRRSKNHAQCPTDAILARVFCRYPRSAPCPRTTPSTVHRFSHCRRRHPVRDARLPGHLGLGQQPRTKGPAALRLPLPKQALHRTQPSPSSAMC